MKDKNDMPEGLQKLKEMTVGITDRLYDMLAYANMIRKNIACNNLTK